MLGGIIAGAMSGAAKGAGQVADMMMEKENKLDLAREMSLIDEQKQLRIGEATAARDFEYKKRDISELEPLRTTAAVDREKAMGPAKAANAKLQRVAEGEADIENLIAYGGNSKARAAVRAKAQDQHVESSASVAQAEATRYETSQKKEMASVLEQIDKATDPTEKARLEEKFKRLSGGKYASRYEAVKVKDADGNEVTEILDKQTGYIDKPRRASATPATDSPYVDGTRLKGKDGKTYVVKNGVPVAE